MSFPNFINKSVRTENPIKTNTILTHISKRISPELYACFSNLNFSGIYKIGSATVIRDCYIGAAYNVTLKITHHLNLLYRGEHHSKGLQDWVNTNGLENIDIVLLRRTPANPDVFENWEQYYLDKFKPKFNTVLHKKVIKFETSEFLYKTTYFNYKLLNEFGNPIVSKISSITPHSIVKFLTTKEEEEKHKYWKPTIIINTEDEVSIRRGDITNIKEKKVIQVKETKVYRNVFKAKGT